MHGYLFDVRNGALVRPRGLCADQRTYVTKLEGEDVTIWDPVEVEIKMP